MDFGVEIIELASDLEDKYSNDKASIVTILMGTLSLCLSYLPKENAKYVIEEINRSLLRLLDVEHQKAASVKA